MNNTLFSERINALSNMIAAMTPDPAERLGLAAALCEIYRFDLSKYFAIIPAGGNDVSSGKSE